MEEGYNREDKYAEKTHERIVVDGSYSFEGRLSQYKDSLRKDYDDLRKELEDKIEKKSIENKQDVSRIESENKNRLPTQWFVWTIAAAVTIVAAWWCLSYSRLLNWQNEAIKQIHEIDIKSEINKADLESSKSREFPITVDEKD